MIELDFDWLNHELITKEEERASKITRFFEVEREYLDKYSEAVRNAPGASQPTRDAQARKVMQEEYHDLFEEYFLLQLDMKLLKNRIDVLSTICSNLRSMEYTKNKEREY